MAHIHKLIDFTVGALITYKNKVLLVRHKDLKLWLPPGGHIELNEDPEQALYWEILEETGLKKNQIRILSEKPKQKSGKKRKFLLSPKWLDIHQINKIHRHIVLAYIVKSRTDKVKLAKKEHHKIKWFTEKKLENKKYKVIPTIRFYAKEALKISRS